MKAVILDAKVVKEQETMIQFVQSATQNSTSIKVFVSLIVQMVGWLT